MGSNVTHNYQISLKSKRITNVNLGNLKASKTFESIDENVQHEHETVNTHELYTEEEPTKNEIIDSIKINNSK